MNYTENYQLPQWVESDRVLMEDFNAANLKVDQTLATLNSKSKLTKIKTVTVSSQQNQVSLNISGVNWGKYHQVILEGNLKGNGDCEILLNNDTDSSYRTLSGNSGDGVGKVASLPCTLWMQFWVGKDATHTPLAIGMAPTFFAGWDGPAYNTITTIQLNCTYERYYIGAGSTLTFWGLE